MRSSKYAYIPLTSHYCDKVEDWLKDFLIHNNWIHKIDNQMSVSYIPYDKKLSKEPNGRVFAYIITSSSLNEGAKFLSFLKKHQVLDKVLHSKPNYEELFVYTINDFVHKDNHIIEKQIKKFFNALEFLEENIFDDVILYLEGYHKHLSHNYGNELSDLFEKETVRILSEKSETHINMYKNLDYDNFLHIYFSGKEKQEILRNTSDSENTISNKKRI